METPQVLETIKDAHEIDQALGRVAEAVTDNALKGRILELKEQWQPIAYEVSARLSGVEIAETPRKRRGGRRRKVEQLGESEHPQGLVEEPENSRGDE